MIFVAVWTIVVVLYTALTPKFMPSLAHVFAILALDALTMLFWFAAFIALAVFHHNLQNSAVVFGDGFYFGAYQTCSVIGTYCHQVEAAVVFGAFEWYVNLGHNNHLVQRGQTGDGARHTSEYHRLTVLHDHC